MKAMFTITKNNSPTTKTNQRNGKRPYKHIELWKRKELIRCVTGKEETMKDCSKRLGINYCTTKHIMKVFRRTGSCETDLMRKKKQEVGIITDNRSSAYNVGEVSPLHKQSMVAKPGDSIPENTQYNTNMYNQQMLVPQSFLMVPTNCTMDSNFLFGNIHQTHDFSEAEFIPELQNI
jgi:hypothetical protein